MGNLVLALFPGIDLLGHAFELEGFTVVRGPDPIFGGDVRAFHPPAGRFDGVIGGPPCQSFSTLANLVRAKGYEPKFGNLIPEFERCVREAQPAWFLMEEVAAPVPQVEGYAVHSFTLCNSSLDSGDGYGQEQERLRVFSFGVRGPEPRDLRAHIQLAALRLPKAPTITQTHVDNTDEAKGRTREGTLVWNPAPGQRDKTSGHAPCRVPAVLSDVRERPVAIGGSGKLKPGGHGRCRTTAVTSSDGAPLHGPARVPAAMGAHGHRNPAVVACHSGAAGRPKGGHLKRYKLAEALRLQGLPEDWLEHCPFTQEGALKAVANGVPIFMGVALARAIRATLSAAEAIA